MLFTASQPYEKRLAAFIPPHLTHDLAAQLEEGSDTPEETHNKLFNITWHLQTTVTCFYRRLYSDA